jgi:hypothetical protein
MKGTETAIEKLRDWAEKRLQVLEDDEREEAIFGDGGYGDEKSKFRDGQIAAFKSVLKAIKQITRSAVPREK